MSSSLRPILASQANGASLHNLLLMRTHAVPNEPSPISEHSGRLP
jgi:hypothetical protein